MTDTGGGYIWTNARILLAEATVDGEVAAALLPNGLSPVEPARATLFVADYPTTLFGSAYREAAVLLHVRDESGPALHCPWMVVDDDTALIMGREVLGFPKKMAEIRLEESGEAVSARVRRKDADVLRLEAVLGDDETDPPPVFGRMVNVVGTLPTGFQRIELSPTSEAIHSSRTAKAEVSLASDRLDPLGDLRAAASGGGRYVTLSFGVPDSKREPVLLGAVEEDWVSRRFYPRAL